MTRNVLRNKIYQFIDEEKEKIFQKGGESRIMSSEKKQISIFSEE